jgi:hypothetical protein
MVVTLPRAQTEMAEIAEFEQQDWVQQLTRGEKLPNRAGKQLVDPNVVFPFDDNFSVGTIHGANAAKQSTPAASAVVEIQDDEDFVSVRTTKIRAENYPEVTVWSRATSGSNPVVGPTAAPTQTATASRGSSDPASAGPTGGAAGGPVGE